MQQSLLLTSTLCGVTSVGTLLASPAIAQVQIEDTVAQQEAIPIRIEPGRTSTIHFQNDENISFIKLGDPSKTVYSVNAPVNSGEAKTIYLNLTEEIIFPGQTTHSKPNLHVVAVDREGNQQNYEFIIDHSAQNDTKIQIIPTEVVENKPVNAINTELGLANPYDVLAGLKYKLKKGEISSDSPLVLYANEAISTTLNSEKHLLEVAEEFQVPLSVLAEFGRVGLIEKAKARRLQADRIQATNHQKVVLPPPPPPKTSSRQVPPPLEIGSRSRSATPLNNNTIQTDLGSATLDDVKFGLSVLRQKNQISEQKAQSLEKVIQGNLDENNPAMIAELRKIARIGLAFETRLRLRGTVS